MKLIFLYCTAFFVLPFNAFAQEQPKDFVKIQSPKIESKSTIFKYLQEAGLDTFDNYFVKDVQLLDVLTELEGFPVLYMFDRNGRKLNYTPSRGGCVNPNYQLATLNLNHQYPIDTSVTLPEYLKDYVAYSSIDRGSEVYDFTVIIYWVKFLGNFDNNEKVKEWESLLRRNTGIRSRILKVNLDVQDVWSHQEQSKMLAFLRKIYEQVSPEAVLENHRRTSQAESD